MFSRELREKIRGSASLRPRLVEDAPFYTFRKTED
jgi:hypothetical protein